MTYETIQTETHRRVALVRLHRPSVRSVLVHDWAVISPSRMVIAARETEELRANGLAESVGVSAYDEQDVRSALSAFERLDVIQVPDNEFGSD